MKSGNRNPLEPSGSLQACNGSDLLGNHYVKRKQEITFFHHFGLHSWNDKKEYMLAKVERPKPFRSIEVCVFLLICFLSFRLKEFNLFAHRVSNCVPFFVRNKRNTGNGEGIGHRAVKDILKNLFLTS